MGVWLPEHLKPVCELAGTALLLVQMEDAPGATLHGAVPWVLLGVTSSP